MAEPLPVHVVRAVDHIRVDRRRRIGANFFTGVELSTTRRQKMRPGYAIRDETTDPAERATLRTMLRRLQSLVDALPESP